MYIKSRPTAKRTRRDEDVADRTTFEYLMAPVNGSSAKRTPRGNVS